MAVTPDLAATVLVATDRIYRCQLDHVTCVASPTRLPATPSALASFPHPAGSWLAVSGEVFTSADSGSTWEVANDGLKEAGGGWGPAIWSFNLDHVTGEVYALSDSGLLRWLAAARRWELADSRPRQWSSNPVGWIVRGEEHLFGGGLPDAPFAWQRSDAPLEARYTGIAGRRSLAVWLDGERGTPLVTGDDGGLWRLREEDGTWVRVLDLGAAYGSSTTTLRLIGLHEDPRYVVAITDAGVFESRDQGWTWDRLPVPFPLSGGFLGFPAAFLSPNRRTMLLGSPWQSLWRSPDLGATWIELPLQAQAIAVHPHHPDVVWAARSRTIYASRDGGRTWRTPAGAQQLDGSAQCPFPCGEDHVVALAVDPAGGETYFLATDGLGLRRFNDAEGWEHIPTPISRGRELILDPDFPGRLLAAGWGTSSSTLSGHVLVLEDRGARWRPLANDADLPLLWALAASFRHGRYAVATEAGVFVLEDAPRDNRPVRRSGPSRR